MDPGRVMFHYSHFSVCVCFSFIRRRGIQAQIQQVVSFVMATGKRRKGGREINRDRVVESSWLRFVVPSRGRPGGDDTQHSPTRATLGLEKQIMKKKAQQGEKLLQEFLGFSFFRAARKI